MRHTKRMMQKKSGGLVAYLVMPLVLAGLSGLIIWLGFGTWLSGQYNQLMVLLNSGEIFYSETITTILKEQESTVTESVKPLPQPVKVEVNEPDIGRQYGRIICESIDMDLPLYFGDNDEVLDLGPGTYPGSWIPGCGRTTLVAGHNQTHFSILEGIEVGDEIQVNTDYGDFVYVVTEYRVIEETDIAACRLEQEKDQLIMYTCYPFYQITGRRDHRFFVYADKVSGPEVDLVNYYFK